MIASVQLACALQYRRVEIKGQGMEPNFSEGDMLRIIETSPEDLRRGDLLLVESDGTEIIKRLIGLPNETVSIHDGEVFIDGKPLAESYEVIPPEYTMEQLKLAKDDYFVLGDNRPGSSDSHLWGPVKSRYIKGKAIPE